MTNRTGPFGRPLPIEKETKKNFDPKYEKKTAAYEAGPPRRYTLANPTSSGTRQLFLPSATLARLSIIEKFKPCGATPRRRPRPLGRLRRLHLKPTPDRSGSKIKEINMECTPKQNALAAIEGLTLYDCLNFFDESEDQRAKDIVKLCGYADDFGIDTYHTSEGEDNGAYLLGWHWFSFEGTKLSKVCSSCASKDGEIKCVEMSDGTTESLCKTCLEVICPGYEAALDRPNRANLKRLATPRSRGPVSVLERTLRLWDDDGQLRDILPPMDIEQENRLRAQAGLPLLDDVAVSARLNAAREEV
jgi:hypothetical protein